MQNNGWGRCHNSILSRGVKWRNEGCPIWN